MKLAVQLELPGDEAGTKVQGELERIPETPVSLKVTAPVGASGLPAVALSTTTTVQSAAWFTTTCVAQAIVAVVLR